jgi:hypothetical protein
MRVAVGIESAWVWRADVVVVVTTPVRRQLWVSRVK